MEGGAVKAVGAHSQLSKRLGSVPEGRTDAARGPRKGYRHVLYVARQGEQLLAVVLDQPVPGLDRLGDLRAPAVILRDLGKIFAKAFPDGRL